MRHRALLGLLIPLVFAALFVRLGVWQLSRHRERAETNRTLAHRLAESPVALPELRGPPDSLRWRRVELAGRFRYELEQVLAGRTNAGSPGVHLITPFEPEGTDTLIAVTRGWVYSSDASAVDPRRWREADAMTISGYLLALPDEGPAPADRSRPLRSVDRQELEARTGAVFAPFQVVMTSDSAARADSVPRRLALPLLDGGPHFSYMLQWFGFALIAIVGGIVLYRRS